MNPAGSVVGSVATLKIIAYLILLLKAVQKAAPKIASNWQ